MKDAKFKKLDVWHDAIQLACETLQITRALRDDKDYTLSSQIWRSCISVSSNIAEGAMSGSDSNYIRHLNIANGSLAEFRSQIALCDALALKTLEGIDLNELDKKADVIGFRLYKLIKYLKEAKVTN